jgi:hypothetical protein
LNKFWVSEKVLLHDPASTPGAFAALSLRPRRTPRQSVIIVLPENHAVPLEFFDSDARSSDEKIDIDEKIDVIVACAGQPASLAALRSRIADLRVVLAPPGTSAEDLRALAIREAPGDIVTLLSPSSTMRATQ